MREAPTWALLVGCYGLWAAATLWGTEATVPVAILVCALTGTLHASLTHEALHGHPTRHAAVNAALVFPALTLTVPYLRFRDTHLAHHQDAILTDPYDDPETNYLDPKVWQTLPRWVQALLRWNNTLAGRMVIGPVLGLLVFWGSDLRLMAQGNRRVWLGWLLHIPAVAIVFWWMTQMAAMPLWAWALSVYMAHSLLKLRTFLEHQAHENAGGRTVIVEDRGLFALLFLNNNLHVVHHMHTSEPWYRLPALYAARRERYRDRNGDYRYRSYSEIFRRYLWRAKDPVPHPLWPKP